MDQSQDDQSTQAGKCRCAEKIDHGCCSDLAGSTFPMEQIPMTMEQKTMGKIIMFRAFM